MTDLVFIHGACDSAVIWEKQLAYFGRRHRVLGVDIPGHGIRVQSQSPDPNQDEYSGWVRWEIEHSGFDRPVLIGNSMGAAVAMAVALHYPFLPIALVLVSGPGVRLSPELPSLLRAQRSHMPYLNEFFGHVLPVDSMVSSQATADTRAWLAARVGQASGEAVSDDMRMNDRFDVMPRLSEIQQPVLVVAGAQDYANDPDRQASLAAKLPDARLVVVPDAGHYVHVEQESRFNQELDAFLDDFGRRIFPTAMAPRVLEHGHDILSVAFSADGSMLATGASDNVTRLWNLADKSLMRTFTGHTEAVTGVAFSPDGRILATASYDGTARLWAVVNGAARKHETLGDLTTATGQLDQRMDTSESSPQPILTLSEHGGPVTSIAWSPRRETVATGSWDSKVRLWQTGDGALIRTYSGHTDRVNCVAFSPDGSKLAAGSEDRTARVWQVGNGAWLATLKPDSGDQIHAVAFSPDGSILATGGWDRAVRLWDPDTGDLLRVLTGHTFAFNALAFSPDGRTLASGSRDERVRLWRVEDGRPIRTIEGHTGIVRCLAYSPDGHTLVSGGDDGVVRLWDAD